MVADLKKQQEDEVKTKAYCVKEFDLNEKSTYAKTEEKKDLESKLELLAATMEQLTSEIEAAKEQIADSKLEMAEEQLCKDRGEKRLGVKA